MGLCLPPSLSEETLQGCKYFRLLGPLFDHLHLAATKRDRARKRLLFYDQYATLLLLYFPLRAAPAAQAARHQPSVLSVPCERACASRWRAGVAGDGLQGAGRPRCARAGRAPGGQHEAGGQTRARAPREGDKGARGATRAVKRSL